MSDEHVPGTTTTDLHDNPAERQEALSERKSKLVPRSRPYRELTTDDLRTNGKNMTIVVLHLEADQQSLQRVQEAVDELSDPAIHVLGAIVDYPGQSVAIAGFSAHVPYTGIGAVLFCNGGIKITITGAPVATRKTIRAAVDVARSVAIKA